MSRIKIKKVQVRTHRMLKKTWSLFFRRAKLSASLTIEAAIGFSLVIFFCISLILPIIMLNDQLIYIKEMDQLSRKTSLYKCIEVQGQNEIDIDQEEVQKILEMGELKLEDCLNEILKKGKTGTIDLRDSRIDNNRIMLSATYVYPIHVLGKNGIFQHLIISRRAFVGAEGNRWDAVAQSEWVYIGETSTRYHIYKTCHYLNGTPKEIAFEKISDLRNARGGRYYACSSCKPTGKESIVYYFESGRAYHKDRECKSLKAYVRQVKKSEVEHLGLCFNCNKMGEAYE